MPLLSEPRDCHGSKDCDGIANAADGGSTQDAAALVSRLGDDRPAWIAALNLTAARQFLESDPPRLAGSRVSLLRLVNSLERDGDAGIGARQPDWRPDFDMPSDRELRAVAQRAAAIAADLDHMIDGAGPDEIAPSDLHAGLSAVRFSILDLDRAIAGMLGDRCRSASLSIDN